MKKFLTSNFKFPKNTSAGLPAGEAGFTLIEALLAIFIFSVALVSLITIAGRGINSLERSKEQFVAQYLALEGVETVRNIRDTNFVGQNDWLSGIFPECDDGCIIEYGGATPTLQGINTTGQVYIDGDGGYTQTATGTESPFSRLITVRRANGNELHYIVESRVNWVAGSIPRSVALTTVITPWLASTPVTP